MRRGSGWRPDSEITSSASRQTVSSIDNGPRQRTPGVGQALSNVSEAFRRKSAAASPTMRAQIRSDTTPRLCRTALAGQPKRVDEERVRERTEPSGGDDGAGRRNDDWRDGVN